MKKKKSTPTDSVKEVKETAETAALAIVSKTLSQGCQTSALNDKIEETMETVEAADPSIPSKASTEGHKKKTVSKDSIKEVMGTTVTADSSITPQTASKRKKKKVERVYTNADLEKALDAVNAGMPVKRASNLYKIPKTTLLYKKRGRLPPVMKTPGPECILGEENERNLVQWILHMSRSGFPVTRVQLLDSVQLLLKHLKIETQFKDNRPGRHWYDAFKNRHREIAERTSQNLTRSRADLSENKLRGWFSEVQKYFESKSLLDIDASRVFNCDEAAFFLSPKGGMVLTKKGNKTVCNFINNDEKECLTTLVCGSASGELVPPMVPFSYKRIPGHITARMPRDWGIGHSDSGWMTGETFYEYVANVFYRWLLKNGVVFPVVLFVDGHTSYLTMALSDFCREKGIELVALYPNATHILQPMDVALFHPLKGVWANVVRQWRLENNGQRLKREDFAPLLQKAIETLDAKSILKNGFETTGLHPFSSDAIDYKKFFKNGGSSERIPPMTQSEGARCKEFLEYVENNVETKVLEMFRHVEEGAEWSGDLAHQSLFYFWRKIKGISINAKEVSHVISVDSVVQEGHVDDKNGVSIHSEHTADEMEQEGNREDLNVINMDELLSGGDKVLILEDEISHKLSAVDADCKTTDVTVYEIDAAATLVPLENVNESAQAETELRELQSQCVDERPKEPTSPKPSTSNSQVDIPPGIHSPFKHVFLWPPKKEQLPKKNQPKQKVPAVLTSDEWIEYAKAKDEKKRKEEEEKNARKEERLRKAQLKKEQQEIAKAAKMLKKEQLEIARTENKIQKEQEQVAKKITQEELEKCSKNEPKRKKQKKQK